MQCEQQFIAEVGYFLNDPASMATNSGACCSETAGTATLIIFDCVSAENAGFSSTSNKNVREMMIVRRSIVAPEVNDFMPRLSQAQ